jgi:pyruvate-formate lyase-activating enzyme
MDVVDDFYCNQKFTWLTVDIEKKMTNSCCAATSASIDMNWLKANPGKLFNTPLMHQERTEMLKNLPVASCETMCWTPERLGLPSRRQIKDVVEKTHTTIESTPETLNIVLGKTCNLTCSYCCKEYSSAWYRDIKDHGSYIDTEQYNSNRFNITIADNIYAKLSQQEIAGTDNANVLISNIAQFKNVDTVEITGGEPFLYSTFPDLLNNLHVNNVLFYTGLGINSNRLQSEVNKIKNRDRVTAIVSAENIGSLYEFNRYGNSYENFQRNLKILQDSGLQIIFGCTISNLTLHGLLEFSKIYSIENAIYTVCLDPDFLNINVLDQHSKDQLIAQLSLSNIAVKEKLISTISQPYSEIQKQNFVTYVTEFAKRRDLNLNVLPESMVKWIHNES